MGDCGMQIGAYQCETDFETFGSGSARWCKATKAGEYFFLKQFLSPVRPATFSGVPFLLQRKQRQRCDTFEQTKKELYQALGCTLGDGAVPVADFFSFEGRFYTASEWISMPYETFETLGKQPLRRAHRLLYSLARCMSSVHAQGIVHADLKPEHVLIQDDRVRLIDFDSGFLQAHPPADRKTIEVDPAYMSPEMYLHISGKTQRLTGAMDTFAFGLIAHRLLTGQIPQPDGNHTYLYETVLAKRTPVLAENLEPADKWMISKVLSLKPEDRPNDGRLERLLRPVMNMKTKGPEPLNSLYRYWLLGDGLFTADTAKRKPRGK